MTVPPLDLDSIMLAAHVTKVFGLIHRIAYAFVSSDFRVLRASDNFASVLSLPGERYLGQPLSDIMWEFVGVEEELTAVLDGRLPYLAFERVHRRQLNGQTVYLDISITMVHDYELGRGLLLIAEDVTHAAEAEQRLTQNRNELALTKERLAQLNQDLQRLDRMKTLFLSMAAHDLRAPLTIIRAYSDLGQRLLAPQTLDKVREFLRLIYLQTSHMDWLINDFLDLDQIEQGTLRLQLAQNDLNQLIQEVTNLITHLAEGRGLVIEQNLHPQPLLLNVDGIRIQQVLFNLLTNAIKYSKKGGKISVYSGQEGETAVLRVTDTGIGMSSEEIARAFQLYYRAHTVADISLLQYNETRGKGLGLFIVKMLVEAHNGRVTLESERGKGSSVTVYLPMSPDGFKEPSHSDTYERLPDVRKRRPSKKR